jgi:hypothetical protein
MLNMLLRIYEIWQNYLFHNIYSELYSIFYRINKKLLLLEDEHENNYLHENYLDMEYYMNLTKNNSKSINLIISFLGYNCENIFEQKKIYQCDGCNERIPSELFYADTDPKDYWNEKKKLFKLNQNQIQIQNEIENTKLKQIQMELESKNKNKNKNQNLNLNDGPTNFTSIESSINRNLQEEFDLSMESENENENNNMNMNIENNNEKHPLDEHIPILPLSQIPLNNKRKNQNVQTTNQNKKK